MLPIVGRFTTRRDERILRHDMPGLIFLIGIFLLITTAGKGPQVKPLSGWTKAILLAVVILFGLYTAFIAWKVPTAAPEMIGQAAGYVIILLVFTGVGALIHKLKAKRG